MGAAAVLLIAAVLNDDELISFFRQIKYYGMMPLIEVHVLKMKYNEFLRWMFAVLE